MNENSLISKIKEFQARRLSEGIIPKKMEFVSMDLNFVEQQIKEVEEEKTFQSTFAKIVTCDYDIIYDADECKEKYRINVYFHYLKANDFGELPSAYDLGSTEHKPHPDREKAKSLLRNPRIRFP